MSWVAINKAAPPTNRLVLAISATTGQFHSHTSEPGVALWTGKSWERWHSPHRPTHWQDLPSPPGKGMESLSKRQQDVLSLIANGFPDKQIAKSLGISMHTVKAHVGVVRKHLGAKNRLEVALIARAGAS